MLRQRYYHVGFKAAGKANEELDKPRPNLQRVEQLTRIAKNLAPPAQRVKIGGDDENDAPVPIALVREELARKIGPPAK